MTNKGYGLNSFYYLIHYQFFKVRGLLYVTLYKAMGSKGFEPLVITSIGHRTTLRLIYANIKPLCHLPGLLPMANSEQGALLLNSLNILHAIYG